MNIENNEVKKKCTGCGMCSFKCPAQAINMSFDKKGFKYPIIDTNKCTKCGMCYKICPSIKENNTNGIINNPHYAVKHKNDEIRKNSRSGGVFTAISDYVISKNGIVYGAVIDNVRKIKHIRATSKKERDKMRGSKYVQSDIANIYKSIESDLKDGKLVLFTGTPCQCAAVKSLFTKYDNLILIDFICHGIPSPGFFEKYIDYLEKKYKEKVLNFVFRDKEKHSWESHVEKIVFNNKYIYSKRYTNLFTSNYILRESCFNCNFIQKKHSDITIGDYWGIEKVLPDFKDKLGVSVVILNTKKGKDIFQKIENSIQLEDTSKVSLTHYNLKRPTKKPDDYDEFWSYNENNSYFKVSKKYGRYDLLHLLKYKIKDKMDCVVKKDE